MEFTFFFNMEVLLRNFPDFVGNLIFWISFGFIWEIRKLFTTFVKYEFEKFHKHKKCTKFHLIKSDFIVSKLNLSEVKVCF